MAPPRQSYTMEEVGKHRHKHSLWMVLGGKVYDLTRYLQRHPGGAAVLLRMAGQDATEAALAAHRGSQLPWHVMKDFCIGVLAPSGADAGEELIHVETHSAGGLSSALGSVQIGWEPHPGLTDEEAEALSGEEALVAVADLLCRSLRHDPRLASALERDCLVEVAVNLRTLLSGAFGPGAPWPAVRVGPVLAEALSEALAAALEEASGRRPRRGGGAGGGGGGEAWHEDIVTGGLAWLAKEMRDDPRVLHFFGLLQTAAVRDPVPEEEDVDTTSFQELVSEPVLIQEDTTSFQELVSEPVQIQEDIDTTSFEELVLELVLVQEAQMAWAAFLKGAHSREAAGEAIYGAILEAAPSLQGLFKTPRAVMAMRLLEGLHGAITSLGDPSALKSAVEALAFQHIGIEVTKPRVFAFRDAILDLLATELDSRMTPAALEGLRRVLSYIGGAYIYVRLTYTDRLRILASSWASVNHKQQEAGSAPPLVHVAAREDAPTQDAPASVQSAHSAELPAAPDMKRKGDATSSGWLGGLLTRRRPAPRRQEDADDVEASRNHASEEVGSPSSPSSPRSTRSGKVPTTFAEMFNFNAAVMGFAGRSWMQEVLCSFDDVVTNAARSQRLQEECDVLALRLAKCKGPVNLPEFRNVMLASLRSLLPKVWDSAHEVAWSWLWENVQRMLEALAGKPAVHEQALAMLIASLDEGMRSKLRRAIYHHFFRLAPSGEDHFKQSTTRLHFIVDRVVELTLEMYRSPRRMVEDLSALGLRHVGYGIPTDLFGPYVSAGLEALREVLQGAGRAGAAASGVEDGFRWSLTLIARILVRTITEGSTIVMKAINANSAKMLRKAVSCAPRGSRASWVLNVKVGTQSISPLVCALENGSLEAAGAIIDDLLTIRADRDRYYYGADDLFVRHPDIVKLLLANAPLLLPRLLDGLVWRSRSTEAGHRRVNYYLKHLLQDADGGFNKTLHWLVKAQNPRLLCHPIVMFTTDTVWSRVAYRTFLIKKSWVIFTLAVFVLGQAILSQPNLVQSADVAIGAAVAASRLVTYVGSLGAGLVHHVVLCRAAFRAKETFPVLGLHVPKYLRDQTEELNSFLLAMFQCAMLATEPLLYCPGGEGDSGPLCLPRGCPGAPRVGFAYTVLSMVATGLFFALLADLAALSTKVAAFVLLCRRLIPELLLALLGVVFLVLTFGSAASSLEHGIEDFRGIHVAALSLGRIALGMYSKRGFDGVGSEPALFVLVVAFIIGTVVFLWNVLVAQLCSSYSAVHEDIIGYARMTRASLVCSIMQNTPKRRWARLLAHLQLDQALQFEVGDLGPPGGVQVLEPASWHPTTADSILRAGGSTSPAMPWPGPVAGADEDRLDRLEKLLQKAFRRQTARGPRPGGSGGGSEAGSFVGSVGGGGGAGGGSSAGSLGDGVL